MRLLVTGGAGYIGSVVTSQLLDAGHHVTVVDDLSTGHRDAVPRDAELIQTRIQDVERFLPQGHFDAVIHFAAKSLVGESMEHPDRYWENNVGGSFHLLEAVRKAGIQRFVFSSTAATYGQPTESPITEDARTDPVNAYGASKLAVDMMLTSYCQAHGIAATSLRYFNVGGARSRFGERHTIETHLIPNLLMVAAGQRESAKIFGTDYDTADGTAIRDYVHVVDLGRAHILALDANQAGTHRILNLGSGSGFTVRQVLDTCRQVTGHPIPATAEARRPGDPTALVASNQRVSQVLGWQPTLSLVDIVSDAWAFMRDGEAPLRWHS
jgi:UDP-glucose 4-epimerase